MSEIFYKNFKKTITQEPAESILETSLRNDIAHAHACGGNGVCSSCRVCVYEGLGNLHPRNEKEQRLATKLGFTKDIRLGCQTTIRQGDVSLRLPVLDEIDIHIVSSRSKGGTIDSVGEQKLLSFLFADMEGFTSFTESSQPYDVVHILNRYYYSVGKLVKEHNGFIVDYFGDGFLAVFGMERAERHALDAVKAGLAINKEMERLNDYVRSLLDKEFKLRVGIHSDKVIVGTIGMEGMRKLSVIGDGVNFASRIESANKDLKTYFLISENTYELTKDELVIKASHTISVKGKTGTYKVFEVNEVSNPEANAEVQEELETEVENYLIENIPQGFEPDFLRLAFHDATSFDSATGAGGVDGSVIRPDEVAKEDNSFIDKKMISFLHSVIKRFPPVSLADVIAIAGAVGVRKLGGPEIHVGVGRVDNIKKGPESQLPDRHDSVNKLKHRFELMGLSSRDLVALSGAHTIGKADGKPFTEDFKRFSNSYFVALVSKDASTTENMLPSDLQLREDPELWEIVQEYAESEERFFEDFAESYRHLVCLGH